jgi:hypothetical protein
MRGPVGNISVLTSAPLAADLARALATENFPLAEEEGFPV